MTNDSFIASFAHSGGKSKKQGNLFYEGDTLYSYGRHFPLLKRYGVYYLFNPTYYSSNTQRHQSECRKLYSGRLIHTPDCDLDNFHPYHLDLIKNILDKMTKARNLEDKLYSLGIVMDAYLNQCQLLDVLPVASYQGSLVEWVLEQRPQLKAKLVKYQLR